MRVWISLPVKGGLIGGKKCLDVRQLIIGESLSGDKNAADDSETEEMTKATNIDPA